MQKQTMTQAVEDLKYEVVEPQSSTSSRVSPDYPSISSDGQPTILRTPQPNIEDVFALEKEMLQMPQVSLECFHHFSPGIYARELHLPAGTVTTGAVHRFENMNILSKGTISIATEEGPLTVSAPYLVISPPGTKRAVYAHTDCVWTTILHTNETNVQQIEKDFVCKTEQEYLEWHSPSAQLSLPLV